MIGCLYLGTNAYGEGTYFAKHANYSANPGYAAPDRTGLQRMYMCKVLTGEYTQGSQGMRVLPNKPRKKNEIYNSLVDYVQNPQIFVIFHDAQAYPEYLITFSWLSLSLHDTVCTYTRMILPRSLVSFLYSVVWRKTTKHTFIFDSPHNRKSFHPSVCSNILVTQLYFGIMIWT